MIIYLLAGVCLMRILREEGKLTGGRNIAILIILLIGSLALSLLQAPQLIMSIAGFIYRNVIMYVILGVAYVFGAAMYGIFWVLSLLFNISIAEEVEPAVEAGGGAEEIFGEETEVLLRGMPPWLQVIAMILLAFLIAYIIYSILRRLIGRKAGKVIAKAYTEEREKLHKSGRSGKTGIIRPKDPRQAVRWYYRKYLKEGASRGASPELSDTSSCIQQKYGPYFQGGESGNLRDVYIKARYRYGGEIPKSDVDLASRAWRELKQK